MCSAVQIHQLALPPATTARRTKTQVVCLTSLQQLTPGVILRRNDPTNKLPFGYWLCRRSAPHELSNFDTVSRGRLLGDQIFTLLCVCLCVRACELTAKGQGIFEYRNNEPAGPTGLRSKS